MPDFRVMETEARGHQIMERSRRRAGFRPQCGDRLEARALLAPLIHRPHSALPAEYAEAARPITSARPRPLYNITYTTRDDQPQALDLYRPAAPAPPGGRPVVLAIHGGGWWRFSKSSYGPKAAAALVPEGFAVVAPNYTLATPSTPSWPLNLDQMRDAVRWVRAHAAEYDLDPTRVVAMGESAGGHLAAMLGAENDDPDARVQAVVDFYGPTDLSVLGPISPIAADAARKMLGATPEAAPAVYQAASPMRRITKDFAPTIILQGTRDWVVPRGQSESFAAALTRAGVTNELVLVPRGQHGFGFRVGSTDLVPQVTDFLREVLDIPA